MDGRDQGLRNKPRLAGRALTSVINPFKNIRTIFIKKKAIIVQLTHFGKSEAII